MVIPLLLRLSVYGVLAAEAAILIELEPVRVVLLVLERIVVSLLALGARQCNLNPHDFFLPF
jgi:hypothetical protein